MKYKKRNKPENSYNKYTEFKKIELVAEGSIVTCKATTVDGVTELYDWSRQSKREFVRNNCISNVEVIVDPSVPKCMGWDYGRV